MSTRSLSHPEVTSGRNQARRRPNRQVERIVANDLERHCGESARSRDSSRRGRAGRCRHAAYRLGRQSTAEALGAASAAPKLLPVQHPSVSPRRRSGEEGKVEFDKSLQFVHYRVGNKNVKRIYADGETLWWERRRPDPLQHPQRRIQAIRRQERPAFERRLPCRPTRRSHRAGHVWRRHALMDPRTEVWETYNIPMDWGCLRVRRAASVQRRRLDCHLVGREPRARRRAQKA